MPPPPSQQALSVWVLEGRVTDGLKPHIRISMRAESPTSTQVSVASTPTSFLTVTTSADASVDTVYEALKASATQSYASTRTTTIHKNIVALIGMESITIHYPNPPITSPVVFTTISPPPGPLPTNFESVLPILVLTKVEADIFTRDSIQGFPFNRKSNHGTLLQPPPQVQLIRSNVTDEIPGIIPVEKSDLHCVGNTCINTGQIIGIVIGIFVATGVGWIAYMQLQEWMKKRREMPRLRAEALARARNGGNVRSQRNGDFEEIELNDLGGARPEAPPVGGLSSDEPVYRPRRIVGPAPPARRAPPARPVCGR